MDRRIVAWAEISIVFLALYLGVPLAGLTIDRGLGLATFPVGLRFAGFAFLLVGLGGLAWCFSLFAGARGTPNPRLPPSRLVTSGPYAWTRNPIEGHAGQVTQQPFDVAFPDDCDDVAAGFRDLTERSGHRHVPLVDQDALRGRELRRKLS